MDIGHQIAITVAIIGILLLILYLVRKNADKIKVFSKKNTLLEVKETVRIDAYSKVFLIGVSGHDFLVVSSKNGQNIIRVMR